jgi:hypothetical protein
MGRLIELGRSPIVIALIWLGFAVMLMLATKPVWGRLIFGYQPTLEELLSLRCFGV